MPGLFSGFCSGANHEMCLSPKTIYPLRRVSLRRDREEEEEEEQEQRVLAVGRASRGAGRAQGTCLIHRAAVTARPWQRPPSLANDAIHSHMAGVMRQRILNSNDTLLFSLFPIRGGFAAGVFVTEFQKVGSILIFFFRNRRQQPPFWFTHVGWRIKK